MGGRPTGPGEWGSAKGIGDNLGGGPEFIPNEAGGVTVDWWIMLD